MISPCSHGIHDREIAPVVPPDTLLLRLPSGLGAESRSSTHIPSPVEKGAYRGNGLLSSPNLPPNQNEHVIGIIQERGKKEGYCPARVLLDALDAISDTSPAAFAMEQSGLWVSHPKQALLIAFTDSSTFSLDTPLPVYFHVGIVFTGLSSVG